jgi:hypothetical protein
MLAKHPQFKPLRALFEKTGLDGDLKDSRTAAHNSFTVFAPTGVAGGWLQHGHLEQSLTQ